ncbi:hypothetical protein [Halorussus pelagicus]|uniref:hypothetical protein n=1 Tax=Halorussus pelagicus TaxID=2505977 RepID=UPI000FFB4DAF|nr:hypothetical protein [Halorussus pelagicus]
MQDEKLDDADSATNRRSLLQLAALAGLPFAFAGNASASTDHDHMGETWGSSSLDGTGLNIELGTGVPLDLHSNRNSGLVATTNTGASAIQAISSDDSGTSYGLYASAISSNPDAYSIRANGDVRVEGDFEATGTKNFVQSVETADGEKQVAYTAVEADQAQTETTGVAELDDGRAEIDLPEHFGMVTSDDEDLVVQLTPYEIDVPGLAVTERTTDSIVVQSRDGTGDFEFSYTVRGVREGYEETPVVSDSE